MARQRSVESEASMAELAKAEKNKDIQMDENALINCLRNERVIVRHVPKEAGRITNPNHVLYGGMANDAVRYFTVPMLQSGTLVNVLTNAEKAFLEDIMRLDDNALSVHNKKDNYWDNFTVRLTKQDNVLDLSVPDDYIKYKVLLANKNEIAPSLEALNERPKATYQFVIVSETEESRIGASKMSATMKAYMEFGKIQDDIDALRVIIELLEGKPTTRTTRLEVLQDKVNKLIQANAALFNNVVSDPLLNTKILIKKCIEEGLISNRGNQLYLKSDGTPLCDDGQEPTLSIAAQYLNNPRRQELKHSLEAKVK